MIIKKLKKDFIWYSVGAAIPMILNLIKMPIFTRYFDPTDYGYLTLINTTYSYINLFAFSWIISCIWRFYLHEKNKKELNKFFNNIIFLFIIGFAGMSAITIVWVSFTGNIIIKKLIIANYISLITSSITNIYLTIIRLDGKSLLYNLYIITISILSSVLLCILTFVFKSSIDAMINCSNIVNTIFLFYIIYKFNKNYKLSRNNISLDLIKDLLTYGFATLFFNMSLLLLTSGDRYVIKIFCSEDKVGIYNQIYNISQVSIVAFINIFFNIINPHAFKLFEENIENEYEFCKYIILYIICLLPITVYFSLYSKQIADILLGEKFRIGYKMMPFVIISSFIYGLSSMHETRMKFKKKLKAVSINLFTASIINVVLNFIFIPIKGYEVSVITTLVSYIYLYIMDTKSDIGVKILKKRLKFILSILLILFIQITFHCIVKSFLSSSSVTYAIIEGSIFILFFYTYLYIRYGNYLKYNKINEI